MFTSDEALDLAFVPEYVAIVGSGYIGLEFSDVYTALGSEVTFIEVRRCFFFIPLLKSHLTIHGASESSKALGLENDRYYKQVLSSTP